MYLVFVIMTFLWFFLNTAFDWNDGLVWTENWQKNLGGALFNAMALIVVIFSIGQGELKRFAFPVKLLVTAICFLLVAVVSKYNGFEYYRLPIILSWILLIISFFMTLRKLQVGTVNHNNTVIE